MPGLIIGIVTGSFYGLLQYTAAYLEPLVEFFGFDPEISQFKYQRLNIAKVLLVSNLAFFAMLPWLWQRQKTIAFLSYLFSDCLLLFGLTIVICGTSPLEPFSMSKISAEWAIRLFTATLIAGLC